MKQVVSDNIKTRLSILRATTSYTFQSETAHLANNWASILSTVFYTISNIIFIDVLYANVTTIAGYSRNEMLLFMYIGQISYYVSWLIHTNLDSLVDMVNTGLLDLILVRPVPSLFYVTFQRIRLYSVLRDCVPPMIVLTLVIKWQELNLNPFNLFAGLLICLMGTVCAHVVHFIATLPVFWIGQSAQVLDMSENIEYNIGKIIPYEGFGKKVQFFFTVFVPYLISAGVATSVVLGKTSALVMFPAVLVITLGALVIKQYAWNTALRAYSSASS